MEKPDVDSIDGLSPAIDQKTTSRNPRSTVGTVTEIYDYLRLLWARIGKPHCPECGEPIEGQSVEQITDRVMTLDEGTRFMVMAPVVRGRKGEFEKLFEQFRLEGYSRVRVDGELRRLDEEIKLDKKYNHDISVVVDRLVMKTDLRRRLPSRSRRRRRRRRRGRGRHRQRRVRSRCGREPRCRPEMTGRRAPRARRAPASCRPTSPTGSPSASGSRSSTAAPRSRARAADLLLQLAARRLRALPRARLPASGGPRSGRAGPDALLSEGALQPWRLGHSCYWKRLVEAVAEDYGIDSDAPWQELDEDKEIFLYGTGGERQGHLHEPLRATSLLQRPLRGDRQQPRAPLRGDGPDGVRERVEGYMAEQPCPDCKGARLRPESLAVKVGGISIHDYTGLSARAALTWIEKLEMTDTERAIARLLVREITERLAFLENVGVGYLNLARSARTLSGGEAQRIRSRLRSARAWSECSTSSMSPRSDCISATTRN